MKAVSRAGMALGGALMLAACHSSASSAPPVAPVNTGLSDADAAGIKADAKARLLTRTTGFSFNSTKHLCSDFFSFGEPQIIDSALAEQTGKVRLLIPVTLYNAQIVAEEQRAPDIDCYGFSHPGWVINQPHNVTFEFQVERWQTGWRVAEVQANGF